MADRNIRVATRGSALARTQTEWVVQRLRAHYPAAVWDVRPIQTEGDRRPGESLQRLGGRGVFVKALEDALRRGEADLAVHSLKDMTTTLPAGLTIAAVPEREDARDVFISRTGASLADLPPGARVGTGAPRRAAQLRLLRPDLHAADVRGNVDTRLRKLRGGDYDALILAAAGLRRLGLWDAVWQALPVEAMLPAVGQGALALECRADDAALLSMLVALDHPPTRAAVTAERAFLRALGGGCLLPVAAYAVVEDGGTLWLRARVIPPEGDAWDGSVRAPLDVAENMGRALAEGIDPAWRNGDRKEP